MLVMSNLLYPKDGPTSQNGAIILENKQKDGILTVTKPTEKPGVLYVEALYNRMLLGKFGTTKSEAFEICI